MTSPIAQVATFVSTKIPVVREAAESLFKGAGLWFDDVVRPKLISGTDDIANWASGSTSGPGKVVDKAFKAIEGKLDEHGTILATFKAMTEPAQEVLKDAATKAARKIAPGAGKHAKPPEGVVE